MNVLRVNWFESRWWGECSPSPRAEARLGQVGHEGAPDAHWYLSTAPPGTSENVQRVPEKEEKDRRQVDGWIETEKEVAGGGKWGAEKERNAGSK